MLLLPPDSCEDPDSPARIAAWLSRHAVAVLNVAGDRESTLPGIGARVEPALKATFSLLA